MSEQDDRALIAVLGATGQQGGAVIEALLTAGENVRAIVRDPGSDRARTLAGRGVEVVEGDQERPESLQEPLSGLDSLFVMTTFEDGSGTEGEIRKGTAVAEAAAEAGVPRVVYSSVEGADRRTGIPHFESKATIEQRFRALLPTLVVRPVYFMDNLAQQLDGFDPGAGDGFVLRVPMPGDVPLQLIAVRDIGRVAATALVDPDALGGDALGIAGDELTGEAAAALIGDHLGVPARFEQVPVDSLGDDDIEAMFRWLTDTPGYRADIERTRTLVPDLLDLSGWLSTR